ncbi:hypothetical protein [Streptomyces sp. NPDC006285]|uniref:hypothetical protein n=1 Tax=Streptomyces sp. NPDC006285 TaxID=3364742 RepID=UPI0036AA9A92
MITHRRYELAATAGAVILAALTVACVYRDLLLPAVGLALGAAVLLEAAVRERRRYLRAVEEAEWARQQALGLAPAPLDPCCLLGKTSHGAAHRACTDPRTRQRDERDSA